jgi:hypothetical protein
MQLCATGAAIGRGGGVARAQHLPCAAEMIAVLDDLNLPTQAALDGDAQARPAGQASLRRVTALMSAPADVEYQGATRRSEEATRLFRRLH